MRGRGRGGSYWSREAVRRSSSCAFFYFLRSGLIRKVQRLLGVVSSVPLDLHRIMSCCLSSVASRTGRQDGVDPASRWWKVKGCRCRYPYPPLYPHRLAVSRFLFLPSTSICKICFPACFKLRPLPLATTPVDARSDKASDAQRILADMKGCMDKGRSWYEVVYS